jgi:hypothetical protein
MLIENTIDDRTLSRVLWPQHLPDLNLCDLYLWDMLKNHIQHDLQRRNSEFIIISFTVESTCAMKYVCDVHLRARGHHFVAPSLNTGSQSLT